MKVNSNKLYSFYLALVSFVSIIAIAITLGIVLTSLGKFLIISDEEYLQNRRSYEIRQCEENNIKVVSGIRESNEKTVKDIEECEIKVRESAIMARKFNLKDMFITSFSWLIVFLIVFIFHYPKFLKTRES